MLVKVDAKQIEWRVACVLSQDQVGLEEIKNGVDMHSVNQERFGLPSRLIAKTFLFRLIYGGTEYAYARDREFEEVSRDPDFWREIIAETYRKYYGLARWHERLVQDAIAQGSISIPCGTTYVFRQYEDKRGVMQWPRTNILNYPVQGFAAEILKIIRISAFKRLRQYRPDILFINTVHDDIQLDIKAEMLDKVAEVMYSVFRDAPKNLLNLYDFDFNCPLTCEISYGPTLGDLKEYA